MYFMITILLISENCGLDGNLIFLCNINGLIADILALAFFWLY
jgi:hypothetical protein